VVACEQLLGLDRRYAHHQSALAADGHRHVAVDQERQPAEHPLLINAALGGNEFADAVGQVFVVGHWRTLTRATDIHFAIRSGRDSDYVGGRLQRLRDDLRDVGHRLDLQGLEHVGRDIVQVGLIALRDENR
jgi:hypothetical protein